MNIRIALHVHNLMNAVGAFRLLNVLMETHLDPRMQHCAIGPISLGRLVKVLLFSHVIVSLITGWIVFGVIVSVIILSTIGMIVVFKIRKIRMKSKERKGSFVKMVDTMNVVKSNPNISNNMKEMRRE